MLIISSGPQAACTSVWLGYKSGVPMIPSSGLMIWYNGSQNSGKHLFLWFVTQNIKKDTDEQPEGKVHKMTSRRVQSPGASVSMKFAPLSQNVDVFINPKSPWTSSFTDFYEGIIMQAWSMINSISNRPLPFLENGGRVVKFQASNHGLVFLVTSPYPEAYQVISLRQKTCLLPRKFQGT